MASKDRALIRYDFFQQRNIVVLRHRHIAVAAHARVIALS